MTPFPDWGLELATPALVYDLDELRRTAARYAELSRTHAVSCCYSVKANRHPRILSAIVNAGLGADIASMRELAAVSELDVSPLVATSPGMTGEMMRAVVAAGGTIFFDHVGQVEAARALDLDLEDHGVRISMPGSYRGFGFSGDELAALSEIGFQPRKVHAHAGELIDLDRLERRLDQITRLTADLDLSVLDLGGGFGVLSNVAERLEAAFARLGGFAAPRRVHVVVEPGKAIVARCGVLIATVLACKRRGELQIVTLDASSFNLGDMEARRVWTVTAEGRRERATLLLGPTCYEGDVWGRFDLPALAPGDRVAFAIMGAYTRSIAASLHGLPPPNEHFLDSSTT